MDNLALDHLVADWRSAGIEEGDTVLLHSDLSALLRSYRRKGFNLTVETVLDSFLKALGTKGTALFPLFNFDFTNGAPFDIRSTPSQMGALTEAARLRPDVVRTGHPIYSFAAIGAQAYRFAGVVNFSGYGVDSPFGILREIDGKIGVLNLPDQHSMTFYHHVEEMLNVPYRYHKIFSGTYIDQNGDLSTKQFGLFVRDLERGVVTDVNAMGEKLWSLGLYKGYVPKDGFGCRTMRVEDLYTETANVINTGQAEGMLYRIQKKVGSL